MPAMPGTLSPAVAQALLRDPYLKTRLEVERIRRRRAAQKATERASLASWLPAASPSLTWTWRHLVYYQQVLDRVTRGELRRVIVNMPVRHGKSELGTVRYPVYRIERDPHFRVIIGAHTQTLANKFSRKARKLARSRGLAISDERDAAHDWETTDGGGVRAVGVGVGVAGEGANLVLIDDPMRSRHEAESPVYRQTVWDWFTDDIFTRLEPDGAIVVTMARYHVDDLVGRILASEHADTWTVIDLPALAEPTPERPDPLGRAPGEALCPERYDEAALAERRAVLGPYGFASLFQQRPRPREGGMLKWDWFRLVDAVPVGATRVRYWDLAGTELDPRKRRAGARSGDVQDPDFTSGTLMSRTPRGRYCIEDVARGQWGLAQRTAMIVETARADARKYGPSGVTQWLESDTGIGGAERTNELTRALAGFVVHTERPVTNKVARAEPFAAQAEAGNVDMLRAPWNPSVLSVYADFPTGAHDDDVDSAAGAFNKLAAAAGQAWHSLEVRT